MAPLTWRNVDSPSFASANQLYTLAAELMNRGFNSASRGLDKFREITTDEQSARLMQDVMAAGNDPAAIQAATTRGNTAFLSPEALRFANAQPGVLLDRQQAEANIAQTGVRTNALQYGLDRSRITDGRDDAQYAARQEANPLIYQMQELARNGDLSGAQALAAQNADLLSRAGINADTVYNGISSGFTGQMADTERGVQHSNFMRIAGNATNARELIDLAGRAFGTEAEARRGIQDLQAQGLISADLAQTALGSLGQAGLWTAPTAADEIMQRYGAAPINGRGSTDPSWAAGNNPVLNGFMSTIQRGGVTNPYALAAIQATGQHESGFDPGNAGRTWNDSSESGRPGTAGGIMSWNNDRLAALQRFTGGDLSPEAQAAFFLQEDPQLITRLNNAGSVEEAVTLMNNAWRFAGYNRKGGEAEARLNTARSIYNRTAPSLGSNVPRAARQQEIDRVSKLMREATDIAPNANRPYLQPGGLLGDVGMVAAQTGEAVVNQGAELLDAVNAPLRMLSEYALGRDYIGGTGRVDWNRDGYSQSLTSPITRTTRDNLTPEQRAALSSNKNRGQQPGQGQQPVSRPRPATVTSTELSSLLQTAANTGNADQAYDLHAALDRAVVAGNSGETNLGEMASRLRTKEGGLADYSHQDIEGALSQIMSELGVSLPVAAELLGDTRKYRGTDWNPLNWGTDLQFDMDEIRDRWRLYDQGNTNTAARVQAAVGRLNNRGRMKKAVSGIAQVQADYEALVTAMNQQIAQAPNQAQKNAVRQHFERNVFPLLYAQVQAIGATGALTTYSGTRTGQ